MTEKILPIPCTNVQGKTVKDWFRKINEELDEFKTDVLTANTAVFDCKISDFKPYSGAKLMLIAYEAADTITAITSMLEAMGIDEYMRQEAQKRVNERNRERGRI